MEVRAKSGDSREGDLYRRYFFLGMHRWNIVHEQILPGLTEGRGIPFWVCWYFGMFCLGSSIGAQEKPKLIDRATLFSSKVGLVFSGPTFPLITQQPIKLHLINNCLGGRDS